MALTAEQLPTLKADIVASLDPAVQAVYNPAQGIRNDTELARLYNLLAVPEKIYWRTSVSQDEITQNGFDWVRVDNLSVGKARIWEWMFGNQQRVINPSKANVRLGIDECWKGTAADLAVRAAVYAHCKRAATRAEVLYLIGGAGTTADPAIAGFVGGVTITDIGAALNLPE